MKTAITTISLIFLIQILHSQNHDSSSKPIIDRERTIEWIKQNAIPINSVKAESGFDDLMSLKNILNDVQIIGLGEATHGTREFFQMKHRMIEFCVKELGFKVIATEFNYIGAENINNYILYGKGDAYNSLGSQGLMVWDTEEIVDLIKWLRTYNQSVSEENKVRIRGLDIRCNYIGDNFTIINQYLEKVDKQKASLNDSLLRIIKKMDSGMIQGINTDSSKNEFLKLLANFSLKKGDYVQHSSEGEYKNIFQRLNIIGQNLCMNFVKIDNPRTLYYEKTRLRDYFMASNFMSFEQEEKPGTKFIIWGHNMHISKADTTETDGIRMLGNYLLEAYGNKYYTFGFSFDKGSFQTFEYSDQRKPLGMQVFSVSADHDNTIDWYLAKTSINPFIINFRLKNMPDFMNNFLNSRLLTRRIGGEAIRSRVEMMNGFCVIKKSYDAIIFVNNTSRATPLNN
jgi:erythromycin esterase